MADSFSTFLQIRLPATGAYNNTWGSTLNADTFQLVDTAITGWTVVAIGSATNYSLPALTQGSASIARYFSILFTGTPPSLVTVTLPSSVPGKMYLINNQTGQSMLFKYAASTSTVTVANGELRLIWCDGSNCFSIVAGASDSASLGGIPAANWMRQSRTAAEISAATIVVNALSIPTSIPWTILSEGPTTTINCNDGNAQQLTLTGNRVMAVPTNARDGSEIELLVVQDGTGGRTLSWDAIFWFENGTTPVLATAPGAADLFYLKYNTALAKWFVGQFGNLNAGGAASTALVISENTFDWNLSSILGTLGSPVTVNLTIAKGVTVQALSTGTPALDLSGLISGCTVNLLNLGNILGRGGRGGRGAGSAYPGSGATEIGASAGQPGGIAILGPGSGCTFNITNGNGRIWGGGGGGGGGGSSISTSSAGTANAGGGGAGAGGAFGGDGGPVIDAFGAAAIGSKGGDSATGINGTFGAHGTPGSTGTASAQNGGDGGDWGAAGTAGVADTTNSRRCPPGTGGAAAKAIELSGGSATFISGGGAPQVKGGVS